MRQLQKVFEPTATIAVVIPCYNVAAHVEQVIQGLPAYISWIIAVDDCSTDDTSGILERLQTVNPQLVYLRHEVNQGVGGAMLTKENAYTLPLALILIEICFFQSENAGRLISDKRFLIAAAVLLLIFLRFVAEYSTQLNSNLNLDLGGTINSRNYLLTQFSVIWK